MVRRNDVPDTCATFASSHRPQPERLCFRRPGLHIWSPARWRDHCSRGDSPTCSTPGRHPLQRCVDSRRVSRMSYGNEDLHRAGLFGTLAQETPTDLLRSHNTFRLWTTAGRRRAAQSRCRCATTAGTQSTGPCRRRSTASSCGPRRPAHTNSRGQFSMGVSYTGSWRSLHLNVPSSSKRLRGSVTSPCAF
jgi:hypothetical protein